MIRREGLKFWLTKRGNESNLDIFNDVVAQILDLSLVEASNRIEGETSFWEKEIEVLSNYLNLSEEQKEQFRYFVGYIGEPSSDEKDFLRHPLQAYKETLVEQDMIQGVLKKEIAKIYNGAEFSPRDLVSDANNYRKKENPEAEIVDLISLPEPAIGVRQFWSRVFEIACTKGGKMVAALLLTMDPVAAQFTSTAKKSYDELLLKLKAT